MTGLFVESVPQTGLGGQNQPFRSLPLLIIHGLFGSGRNWTAVAKALGLKRRVYLVDLPGHDRSRDLGACGYPRMVEALIPVLKQIRLETGREPAILGHSMGGKVAMGLSLLHPGLLAGLVVEDILPVGYEPHHDQILQLLAGARPETWETRAQALEAIGALVEDEAHQRFMVWNLVENGRGGYRWRFDAPGIMKLYPQLGGWPEEWQPGLVQPWPGPAHFVRGLDSHFYRNDERARQTRRLFPQMTEAGIAKAGHWVHVDQRQKFVDEIDGFLCTIEAGVAP